MSLFLMLYDLNMTVDFMDIARMATDFCLSKIRRSHAVRYGIVR